MPSSPIFRSLSLAGIVAIVALGTYAPHAAAQQKPQQAAPDPKAAPAPKAAAPAPAPPAGQPPPAAAVKPDPAARQTAKTEYAAGEKAYKAGDYAAAVEHFKKANDAVPNVQARYWMALALAQAGKTTEAYAALQALVDDAERDKLGQDKLNQARTKLAELEKMPAKVTLTTAPADATVAVDGTPQTGPSPRTLELSAGTHTIAVTAPGHEPQQIELAVKPGETVDRSVQLTPTPEEPAAAAPPPPAAAKPQPAAPPPPPPAEERSLVPAYVTLGIAGVGAIVGTIFGLQALSAKSDFEDDPTTSNADDAERNALIADMAFGVTVTLGITGIVLLTSDEPSEVSAKRQAPAAPRRARVDVTPYVSPKGGGAAARLAF